MYCVMQFPIIHIINGHIFVSRPRNNNILYSCTCVQYFQLTKIKNIHFQESLANESDPNSQLLSSFIDSHAIKLWKDCCKSAEECCQKMISAANDNSVDRRSKNYAFTEIESSQCKVAKGNTKGQYPQGNQFCNQ